MEPFNFAKENNADLTEEQLESVMGGVSNSLLLEEGRKLGVNAICAVMKYLSKASLTPEEQAWVEQAYKNACLIESLS